MRAEKGFSLKDFLFFFSTWLRGATLLLHLLKRVRNIDLVGGCGQRDGKMRGVYKHEFFSEGLQQELLLCVFICSS